MDRYFFPDDNLANVVHFIFCCDNCVWSVLKREYEIDLMYKDKLKWDQIRVHFKRSQKKAELCSLIYIICVVIEN